jgi:hypothetical protein
MKRWETESVYRVCAAKKELTRLRENVVVEMVDTVLIVEDSVESIVMTLTIPMADAAAAKLLAFAFA